MNRLESFNILYISCIPECGGIFQEWPDMNLEYVCHEFWFSTNSSLQNVLCYTTSFTYNSSAVLMELQLIVDQQAEIHLGACIWKLLTIYCVVGSVQCVRTPLEAKGSTFLDVEVQSPSELL